MRLALCSSLPLALLLACDASGSIMGTGDDDDDAPDAGPGGPGADAMDCPSVQLDLTPTTPVVVLLLDQSGSMTAGFGNTNRYDAMKQALVSAQSGVVASLQDRVYFGASLYTSNGGNAGGTCPVLTSVPPAMNNSAAITSLLDANGPAGDTPTGESITAVVAQLGALSDPALVAAPKVIVLATDGEPDTCAVPNPQSGQPEAIAAAQAAHAKDVRLFILSVGNEVGEPHQQAMANAGAGLPVDGSMGNAPYYNAQNPTELAQRFAQIVNGVRQCTFDLDGNVDPSSAGQGTVSLDGVPLTYGGADGWRLVDENTIELTGAACDTVLTDPNVSIAATFPCGVVIE
jgi:hypothetical protein